MNLDNPAERWSTFKEYSSLISLLFLAAQDEETAAINGYTVDTRVEHFIDELAHIGRAHNWDNTRIKLGATEYADQFAKEPAFIAQIIKAFLIKENDAQVLNLGHLNPEQFIHAEFQPKSPLSQVGFFALEPPSSSSTEGAEDAPAP